MSCSPDQIEKKKKEALQKLNRKNNFQSQICLSPENGMSYMANKSRWKNQGERYQGYKKPYDKTTNNDQKKTNITFHLLSSEKFSVKVSSYLQSVIDIFKTIPSKNYDPYTRTWNFNIKDYETLVLKLKCIEKNIALEQLPRFVVNSLKNMAPISQIDYTKIDNTLLQTLLPFQIDGLRFGIQRNGRCLIADDMGLGKTFQALAILNYYKKDWPLLIVTTASMKNVWEETILKYMPSISIMEVQYVVSGKDYIGNSTILIVSHDLMTRCCEKLLERKFGCIIIDESHYLKNYKTKMTQAALKLCKYAKRVVLLSGTPALSRPKELYSQLSMIDEHFFGSFFEYAKRYCDLQLTSFGYDASGDSNLQELEIILNNKFMIRRKKEDVLGSIPNKRKEVIKLHLNNFENKEIFETLSSQLSNYNESKDKKAALLTYFSETAKVKTAAVCNHIGKLLDKSKKILVFAHHLQMLNGIEAVLKSKTIKYIRIDGTTSGEKRKYFVDKFQTDEFCLCALLSITATNSGITLTAAQHVVFAELHWNPSILNQAEARVHRIGQQNEVLIQYLLADGTADDFIWPLLQKKEDVLHEMGLTKEKFSDVDTKSTSLEKAKSGSALEEKLSFEMEIDDDFLLDDGLDHVLCEIDI